MNKKTGCLEDDIPFLNGVIFNFPSRPFWKTTWCFGKIPGPTPRALPTKHTSRCRRSPWRFEASSPQSSLRWFVSLRCESPKKKGPNHYHLRSSSSLLESAFFVGNPPIFFVRILFHHLIHREFHQILHKMLKIHICHVCQDSVAFHVFFWAAQTVFLASFATLRVVSSWGVFQLFSSTLMDPSIRGFKGWDVARKVELAADGLQAKWGLASQKKK